MQHAIATAAQEGNESAMDYMSIADEVNDGNPTDLSFPDDFDPQAVLRARLAAEHFGAPWPITTGTFERMLGY